MSDREANRDELRSIAMEAAHRYFIERHARVEEFCQRHFSVRGAWRIHRAALGHDLWRAPLNALWAIPHLAAQASGRLASKLGARTLAARLERLPPGFRTAVAEEIEWLIQTELLELPARRGERSSHRDALLETMLADTRFAALLLPELLSLGQLAGSPGTRERLESFLLTYTGSRQAAADLAGSLLNVATGAMSFQKFTPGAVALGSAAAGALAQQLAIADFALGSTLGSLYYGLFPATASASLTAATVGATMLALGVLTAFTGIVTDPIQQAMGLHQRRLHRFLDALERAMLGLPGDFRLCDAYVARIVDIVDILKSAVQIARS